MRLHTIRALRVCCSLIFIAAAAGVAEAQAPVATPKSPLSVFGQVIPKPTGENGYEELVAAGDALRSSRQFAAVEYGKATLDAKRRALRDPPVARALALIRRALAKPVFSPRQRVTTDTLFQEFASFRSLARLLATQQYVLLADGRVPEALESFRLGLRLARAVQTDTLLSGLVGQAMSGLTIARLGAHLDQLSARDCDHLYRICLEWLRAPDPSPRILAGEREFIRQEIADARDGKKGLAGLLGQEGEAEWEPDDEGTLQVRRIVTDLKRLKEVSNAGYIAFWVELDRRIDEQFHRVVEELRKPAWERKFPAPAAEEDLPGRVLSMLVPPWEQMSRLYATEEARIRLLACHAAIRRYRWEHERLPADLGVLRLGELAVDPFTGEPFRYEPRGTRYRLTSAGPPADPGDPRAVEGRVPVSVVPGE